MLAQIYSSKNDVCTVAKMTSDLLKKLIQSNLKSRLKFDGKKSNQPLKLESNLKLTRTLSQLEVLLLQNTVYILLYQNRSSNKISDINNRSMWLKTQHNTQNHYASRIYRWILEVQIRTTRKSNLTLTFSLLPKLSRCKN